MWRVQPSSRPGNSLEPAAARAAREAAYQVAPGIAATVVAIDLVPLDSGLKEVHFTVRWTVPDGQPHRIGYNLSFEATGRNCVDPRITDPGNVQLKITRVDQVPIPP